MRSLPTILFSLGFLLQAHEAAFPDACEDRCGQAYNAADRCHCNGRCSLYRNCCADYLIVCSESCRQRCTSSYNRKSKCHCNDRCGHYGNCCADYASVCAGQLSGNGTITYAELSNLATSLWRQDDKSKTAGFYVDYQGKTKLRSRVDKASRRLFRAPGGRLTTRPTYKTFVGLLDNYDHAVGHQESVRQSEKAEEADFLHRVIDTPIARQAMGFLCSRGLLGECSRAKFGSLLRSLWFSLYARSRGRAKDSSGFEHTFVGELKNGSVTGFHNWIQFLIEEKRGRLNYLGYVKKIEKIAITARFTWYGKEKSLGSMFVGTSPEFDLAMYTVCFLAHPDTACKFEIEGKPMKIQTWSLRTPSGIVVGSAYLKL